MLTIGMGTGIAQETETLINGNISHGGFGAIDVKFSQVVDEPGVWVGGRGAWLIKLNKKHALYLGGGGTGLATEHPVQSANFGNPDRNYVISAGYGGVDIGYVNNSHKLVHFTARARIGGGGLTAHRRNQDDYYDNNSDEFLVLEPQLNAEFNITSFMRITGGISYLYTDGIDHAGYTDKHLSGLTGNIGIKFGGF